MADEKPPTPMNVEDIFAAFGDLFGQFFAGSPHLGASLEVTDEQAERGTTSSVQVTRRTPCTTCKGRGTTREDSGRKPCAKCDGKGKHQHQQGFFLVQTNCEACKGIGAIIKDPCSACSGTTTIASTEVVTVIVPPGSKHGETIRVPGEGSRFADGKVGDVNVFLLVGGRPDPRAAAFDQLPAADLPRAVVRPESRPMPWGVIGAVAVIVILLLVFAAR